jgi:Ca-activated chloride channel family protein
MLLSCESLLAQDKTRILFVFDASNSMNGYWERERKIDIATKLLSETLDEVGSSDNFELALRVYGHRTKHIPGQQDCDDTELVVPFMPANNLVIKQALGRIIPQGTTPIARSLEKAAEDFPDDKNCRNIIILITDGIEACDEDPCAVSRALQKKGIILKPFIIGIGIEDKYKGTFECVGNYYDASGEENFKNVLRVVITQALNNTTVQVNLLNHEGNPVETDVPMSFYNQRTGELLHNFVHTMNSKGLPDTLTLDPLFTYTVVAHTIPAVEIRDQFIKPGEHNIITLEVPQGILDLNFGPLRSEYQNLKCLIRKSGDCDIVHFQEFGTKSKLLSGKYDLEILTTPKTIIQNVEIKSGEINSVQIPQPGSLLLQAGGTGFGGIFIIMDNKEELVHQFNEVNPAGRYTLQPGSYKIVFRSKSSKQTIYTLERTFEIRSGSNTNISLQ